MSTNPRKPPLVLDMDFSEALQRFGQTDVNELPNNIRLKKKGDKSPPSKVKEKPS